MSHFDAAAFRQPPTEYRIHPFWFWNGDMEDEQIEAQIGEMAAQGVGGFFVCARQGLKVPYLSEAWFAKVRVAVEAAAKRGMHVWLYDEYPYPSGIAGGEVTLMHPEAKHYTLEHASRRASVGERTRMELPWARVLYAKAVPVGASGKRGWEEAVDLGDCIGSTQTEPVFQKAGLTAYNRKRFFTYRTALQLEWTAPPGEWEIVVVQEKEIDDFKYYGTFVDPCNREAMAAFIRLTHDKYARYLGEYFGNTVKGMFTDEIGLLGAVPWSPQLCEAFRQRTGYELKDHLQALLYADAPEAPRIRYDYYQTIHLLLRENYHKQVHDWCERHGLEYVAEVPSVRMTTQLFSHVPGGDSAHEKLGRPLEWVLDHQADHFRCNPKIVSSLARQLGRERNLIECFHSVGWSMTLQDAKWMIDRMAALGTNFFNFHAFFYTLDGLTKHDAPPSQFLQNPYWAHFRKLGDYTGRISYLMSRGEPDIEIAVLQPTTSLWTLMGNPFHGFSYGGNDEEEKARLMRLRRDWVKLCAGLTLSGRDYDHLDAELLAEAAVEDGQLCVGPVRYSVLILPPMTNLESAAWRKIREFLQRGGTVIGLGLLPYEPIEPGEPIAAAVRAAFGLEADPSGSYWSEASSAAAASGTSGGDLRQGSGNAYFLAWNGEDPAAGKRLGELLDRLLPRAVGLETEADDGAPFLMQTRRIADGRYAVFVSHQEGGTRSVTLKADPALLFGGSGNAAWPKPSRGSTEPARMRPPGDAGEASRPRPLSVRWSELSLETGEESGPLAAQAADGCALPLTFAPYESKLLLLTAAGPTEAAGGGESPGPEAAAEYEEPSGLAAAADYGELSGPEAAAADGKRAGRGTERADMPQAWQWTVDAAGEWELKPLGPNAVRLDRFRMTIQTEEGGTAGEEQGDWVEVKTLIDQCADLSERRGLPVAMSQLFGTPMKLSLSYPLRVRYTVEFAVEALPESCRLLMDAGAVSGDWTIRINEGARGREHFRPDFLYDHRNVSCDILPLLREGVNLLEVEVTAAHDWDGLVDALYVTGSFGVRCEQEASENGGAPRAVLTAPVLRAGQLDAGPYPGLPYYAGQLSLRRSVTLDSLPDEPVFRLTFAGWDEHFHDCAEVFVNGLPLGVRPWTPYEWTGDASLLREGENELEVRVTNTLAGLLEGRRFDYANHQLIPAWESSEQG